MQKPLPKKMLGSFQVFPFQNQPKILLLGSMFGEVNFSISGTSFWSCVCFAHGFSCDQPHPCRSGFPRVSNPSHPPATGWTNPRDNALKDCGKALWKVGNPSERHASKRKLQKKHVFSRGVSGKIGGTPPKWVVKIKENPIKMDDFGVPLFLETATSFWMLGPYTKPTYSLNSSPLKLCNPKKKPHRLPFPSSFKGELFNFGVFFPENQKLEDKLSFRNGPFFGAWKNFRRG